MKQINLKYSDHKFIVTKLLNHGFCIEYLSSLSDLRLCDLFREVTA